MPPFMLPLLIIAVGLISGAASVGAAMLWSWNLFGDIWHQNDLSSAWYVPMLAILALDAAALRLVGRKLPVNRWHYVLLVLAFVAGMASLALLPSSK